MFLETSKCLSCPCPCLQLHGMIFLASLHQSFSSRLGQVLSSPCAVLCPPAPPSSAGLSVSRVEIIGQLGKQSGFGVDGGRAAGGPCGRCAKRAAQLRPVGAFLGWVVSDIYVVPRNGSIDGYYKRRNHGVQHFWIPSDEDIAWFHGGRLDSVPPGLARNAAKRCAKTALRTWTI